MSRHTGDLLTRTSTLTAYLPCDNGLFTLQRVQYLVKWHGYAIPTWQAAEDISATDKRTFNATLLDSSLYQVTCLIRVSAISFCIHLAEQQCGVLLQENTDFLLAEPTQQELSHLPACALPQRDHLDRLCTWMTPCPRLRLPMTCNPLPITAWLGHTHPHHSDSNKLYVP